MMNIIKATAAKQNFGNCLMNVAGGPIMIEKSGIPAAVMISFEEYNRLMEIENSMLLNTAIDAVSEGFISEDESVVWFNKMNERATIA